MENSFKQLLICNGLSVAAMLFLTELIGTPEYSTLDDVLINFFTEGLYGIGYNQLSISYVGIGITGLLYAAEQILPNINWYFVSAQ